MSPLTGEIVALKKSKIKVNQMSEPVSKFMGENIYQVTHVLTGQKIYITNRNIIR